MTLVQKSAVAKHTNPSVNFGEARRFLARAVPWGEDYIGVHRAEGEEGWKRSKKPPRWKGKPCRSLEAAMGHVTWQMTNGAPADFYVCMGAQRECVERAGQDGKPFKVANKEAENITQLKAYFIDIDAGEEAHSDKPERAYKSTVDALAALDQFVTACDLPEPTIVVGSGNGGLHVYWTLSEAVSADDWQVYADALVEAANRHGLLCDSGCTSDRSRVLRIPGTFNFKYGRRAVKILRDREIDLPHERMTEALSPHISTSGQKRPSIRLAAKDGRRVDDNFSALGPPAKALRIAGAEPDELGAGIAVQKGAEPRRFEDLRRECGFVENAFVTGGVTLSNPLWNMTTLLAAFTAEGRDAAHWMAELHADYSIETTDELFERKQREIEQRGVGWPRCGAIKKAGSKFCDQCPHFGQGRSPLHFALPLPADSPSSIAALPGSGSYQLAFNTLLTSEKAFAYDVFHGRMFVDGLELSDEICGEQRNYIIREANKDPGKDHVFEAARALCALGKFNPVVDYLQGVEWDGQSRLSTWLIDYAGAEDTPLNRAIGRKFLIGMSRRALVPGSKFDTALILEGVQGSGKSSLAAVLAGSEDNFLDHDITHLPAKEQMEQLRGRWIVELPELSGMRRADVNAVKAFMSRRVDRGRPAYGRAVVDQPRTCVFIGTVNEGQYLRDETGNRRFWTVAVGKIDVRGVANDRDQLLAEAVAAVRAGEDALLPSSLWAAAATEQEKRKIEDPWTEILEGLAGQPVVHNGTNKLFVANDDIWSKLALPLERQTGSAGERITRIMTALEWERARVWRDGRARRGYLRDANTTP
jgi:hypothetical protein